MLCQYSSLLSGFYSAVYIAYVHACDIDIHGMLYWSACGKLVVINADLAQCSTLTCHSKRSEINLLLHYIPELLSGNPHLQTQHSNNL